MKKRFVPFLSLALLLSVACALFAEDAARTLDRARDALGREVRQEARGVRLTKDATYTVRLLSKRDGASVFDDALILSIEDEHGEKTLFDLEGIAGYEAGFTAEHFIDRHKFEIFLSMDSGGSGGYGYYYVISFDGRDARVIYDSDKDALPSLVTGSFVDGYRCVVRTHGKEDHAAIDLSPHKAEYDREGVYDPATGKLLKPVDIWAGTYGDMIAMKPLLGGTSSLKGIVSYSGLYHADKLLTVTITQSYDRGRWHPVALELAPWDNLKILQDFE